MRYEVYCRSCGRDQIVMDDFISECRCGSCDLMITPIVKCTCGRDVLCTGFTNVCECGQMYNGFGHALAPVDEWDPDDRYGVFGPQNET